MNEPSASSMFRIGMRVVATEKYHDSFGRTVPRLGTVVGFGFSPHLVRVKRDGREAIISYHYSFWQPAEDHEVVMQRIVDATLDAFANA